MLLYMRMVLWEFALDFAGSLKSGGIWWTECRKPLGDVSGVRIWKYVGGCQHFPFILS